MMTGNTKGIGSAGSTGSPLYGRIRRAAVALAAVAAVAGTSDRAAAQDRIDMTGEWVLTVESPNGTGSREMVVEQEGDTISGTISSSMASGPFEGTIDQSTGAVVFTAFITMGGGAEFEIFYAATWQDGRLVDGVMDIGDYGGGTFTGERVEGVTADRVMRSGAAFAPADEAGARSGEARSPADVRGGR